MAIIEVNIKNNIHKIACNDGEEKRLQSLAAKFKEKAEALSESLTIADDRTLYLITGLMFLDQLEEPGKKSESDKNEKYDEDIAQYLNTVAEKVEVLIKNLEKYSAL